LIPFAIPNWKSKQNRQRRPPHTALCLYRERRMLDSDLAEVYGVETGALVRAVKRNNNRFPEEFSFQLSELEFENSRCQTGTSSQWGGLADVIPNISSTTVPCEPSAPRKVCLIANPEL
jgi:hypothetical protein